MADPLRKARKNHGVSAAATQAVQFRGGNPLSFQATPAHEPTYEVDLTAFAEGKKEGSLRHRKGPFEGRPALIMDLASFLRVKLSSQAYETTRGDLNGLSGFWRFLDELPDGVAPERLAGVDDLIGGLWLRSQPTRQAYAAVRNLIYGARRAAGLDRLYWPPEPRRNPGQANPVCQIGMRRLYHALKAEASAILRHRVLGQELADRGRDPGPVGSPGWGALENQAWALHSDLPLPGRKPVDVVALNASSPLRRRPLAVGPKDHEPFSAKLAWFYPSKVQVCIFHLLVTMQAGWNQETVDNLDVSAEENWLSDHPKDSSLAVVKAVKHRPVPRVQIALSLRRPQFHVVRLIQAMIEMTAPLRDEIRRQLKDAEASLAASPADVTLQRQVVILRDKSKSAWLYFANALPAKTNILKIWLITTPDVGALNQVLRLVIERYDVREEAGKPFTITVGDLRDAWIGYAYQRSGYSWFIAKLAAGHRSAAALQSYLRQRRWRAEGEHQIRKLQDAMWGEIRARRVIDGAVLRMMVQRGDVTEEQRSRWQAHKDRTRMGMGCRNPRQPPASLVPQHVEGETCRFQRCVICIQGILFEDSLEAGLARRNAELIHIRETMPVPAWLQSSWSDELETLEENLKKYDPKKVRELTDHWLVEIRAGRVYLFDQEGVY